MGIEAENDREPLDLTEEQEVGFADEEPEQHEEQPTEQAEEDDGEVVITFGDEDAEEEADATPLVKKLRDQVRTLQRQVRQKVPAAEANDPEPVIPARPSLEAVDYDQDRFDRLYEEREKAIVEHAAWQRRNEEREAARKRQAEEQTKQVEQQVRALGVTDYEDRASAVRDRLSDQQIAVLINATDNPAKLLYALGRSETKLEELASIDNLAKFAARVGILEREIKVSKKRPPAPESKVRGATGTFASSAVEAKIDKLERDFAAGKITDRTEIMNLKRQLRNAA
ncbi:MAG: hypothetical protein KGP14_11540 [Betaproteobacteria bacterium]|nr:hypothetical protein [Betaproteobacteria bacterium]